MSPKNEVKKHSQIKIITNSIIKNKKSNLKTGKRQEFKLQR